jgi:quercetin dioxygenase-like cupin family protein
MGRDARVVKVSDLETGAGSPELVGEEHGGAGVCLIFVDVPPGGGPSLHRHPYEEVFVVQEGRARFLVGGGEREAGPGEVVIVPAGEPHGFVNCGDGPLRQLAIHVSPRFETEWLGEA